MNSFFHQGLPQRKSSVASHRAGKSFVLFLQRLLFLFTGLVITLALASCVFLLVFDAPLPLVQRLAHAPVSAAPLLLIGLASLGFQVLIRPKPLDLFKAGMISSAFILWGVYQLLPTGWGATTLGDIVIVLFVIDLAWMMAGRLKQQGWPRNASQEEAQRPLISLQEAPAKDVFCCSSPGTCGSHNKRVCCQCSA
jgi:hypothetical protein